MATGQALENYLALIRGLCVDNLKLKFKEYYIYTTNLSHIEIKS